MTRCNWCALNTEKYLWKITISQLGEAFQTFRLIFIYSQGNIFFSLSPGVLVCPITRVSDHSNCCISENSSYYFHGFRTGLYLDVQRVCASNQYCAWLQGNGLLHDIHKFRCHHMFPVNDLRERASTRSHPIHHETKESPATVLKQGGHTQWSPV